MLKNVMLQLLEYHLMLEPVIDLVQDLDLKLFAKLQDNYEQIIIQTMTLSPLKFNKLQMQAI